MQKWVVYKEEGDLLVGELLSSKGQVFVYVQRVFEHRIKRTRVYGAFASEETAFKARATIADDPYGFLLRSEVAKLEGHVAL